MGQFNFVNALHYSIVRWRGGNGILFEHKCSANDKMYDVMTSSMAVQCSRYIRGVECRGVRRLCESNMDLVVNNFNLQSLQLVCDTRASRFRSIIPWMSCRQPNAQHVELLFHGSDRFSRPTDKCQRVCWLPSYQIEHRIDWSTHGETNNNSKMFDPVHTHTHTMASEDSGENAIFHMVSSGESLSIFFLFAVYSPDTIEISLSNTNGKRQEKNSADAVDFRAFRLFSSQCTGQITTLRVDKRIWPDVWGSGSLWIWCHTGNAYNWI